MRWWRQEYPTPPAARSARVERYHRGERSDAYLRAAQGAVTILVPLVTQPYGMKEFAITDPDGYIITFAERAS